MRKYLLLLAALAVSIFTMADDIPAFPGAEGHGRYVTGGRGGVIRHVTNLNDSGEGSFRAAVDGSAKKIVVFDVGGVIPLASDLTIGANTTILGQTAPSPGITLRYYTLLYGGDNIIVRFIRSRRGQEKNVSDGADATWTRRHTGIILDHCSFSWSIDEVASFYDNNNFTMQWCTLGESLNNAGHGKGAHGYGGIWGGKLASFHHNLICHVNNRSPRFNGARYEWKGYTSNKMYSKYNWSNEVQAENVDFRNCVIYNCGNGCYGGPGGGYVNMVNNYYKTGPAKATNRVTTVSIANSTSAADNKKYWDMTSRYYINGNQVDNTENYDWTKVSYDSGVQLINGEYYTLDSLHCYGDTATYVKNSSGVDCVKIKLDIPSAPTGEITTHKASVAFDKVLTYSGASLNLDDVDTRYFTEARNGTAQYSGSVTGTKGRIDLVSDVNGYTEENFGTGSRAEGFDTDNDGIPDAWETANGLNPNNPSDALEYSIDPANYYTNLEVYANSLVQEIMVGGNTGATDAAKEYYPAYKKEDGTAVEAINTLGVDIGGGTGGEEGSITLDNESATATFPFNLGTDSQKATFSNADYFLTSSVTYGSNLSIKGIQSGQTTFVTGGKIDEATEEGAIRFIIQPKFGFTFTPSKVSIKATKYGTDNGILDFSWQNPDGSTVSLATGQKPQRNNASPSVSEYSYTITGATAGEGACGLLVNLYGLQENKELGLANIVIEGTLNGTEKKTPVLASFKINDTVYSVADVFGSGYTATLELSKQETMVSEDNPLKNIIVTCGNVGTVTYAGTETACTVTIPMTYGTTELSYVLSVVQKPDYTLTYVNTDGSTLGTQVVEKDAQIGTFSIDIATATSSVDTKKARGWFKKKMVGEKWSTTDVITGDANLYAVETEIEVASDSKKYEFNLTDKYFDAADHEAFNPIGSGKAHSDVKHGWIFQNGDKIELLVGRKATVSLALCAYSNASAKITTPNGEIASKVDTDGGIQSFNYEGDPGTITLSISGTTYIHKITIQNTYNTNYDVNGQWYIVKKGDASSLTDVISMVNSTSGSEKIYIFLPNGTYDLQQQVLTTISRSNVSLIGQSMDGVIIKNAPDIDIEGIGTTATLFNESTSLYLQDLTIQNALDYYGAIAAGKGGGRAVCLQDKGAKTIAKNVKMLSYQDTYYSNANSKYYWETSEIHGTVDYLCGSGDVYYNGCTFVNESRSASGKTGSDVITAPYTDASCQFGYVFNNCTIENLSASFSLGRSWGGNSSSVWLNTTMNQPTEIVSTRFTLKGMNVAAKNFKEYNSMDTDGNVVSPATLEETFYLENSSQSYTYDIILSAEEAAGYTVDKVLGTWDAVSEAAQIAAPTATYDNGTVTWSAVEGASAYALFKNGEFLDITTSNSYNVTVDASKDALSIRSANGRGGFGEAASVAGTVGIKAVNSDTYSDKVIYNLQGVRVAKPTKGIYIQGGRKVIYK